MKKSIDKIRASDAEIRTALASKGVSVPDTIKFSDVPDLIRQIPQNKIDGYLCKGSEFRTRLYSTFNSYTEIEFTTTEPVTTGRYVDVSEDRDGSAIAWLEGTIVKVGCHHGTIYANADCSTMFQYDSGNNYLSRNCKTITLSNFDTSRVNNMQSMFSNSVLENINVSSNANLDTKQVTNMSSMFSNCTNLLDTPANRFDTSSVTNMDNMFYNCSKIQTIFASSWDTSKVTRFRGFCNLCTSLTTFFTGMDFTACENLETISYMFAGCAKLGTVNFKHFDAGASSKKVSADNMFAECRELGIISCSYNWSRNLGILNSGMMFTGCVYLPGYEYTHTNGQYAKPMKDGGYFM